MAHRITGIITSFKYTGELPAVVLVGNYYFIPMERRHEPHFIEDTVAPYDELSPEGRKILKELSFKGACCYIETDYFGGDGTQYAETWLDGQRIAGPMASCDGLGKISKPEDLVIHVENAINENLALIGIYCHEGMDEFDSVRLGWYRSNDEFYREFRSKKQ